MKNILYLVTGATGFLGSTVCNQLLERKEKIRAFAMPHDKAIKFVPSQVEICEGDLCDPESLEKFFTVPEGIETIVIHCASMVTVNPDFNQKLIDINVGGTKNIINKCLEHKECQKLVYVSSTGAIPELPKGNKIKEVNQFDADKVVGCYSQSKALATQAVLDAVRERNLNACVVHPSGILGPGDHAISETTGTIIEIIKGEMPVGMKGSFNLCDVRDLAYGCIMAAEKGKKGECYILGNGEVTLKELCGILSKESGCKQPMFYLPLGLAKLMAKMMEKQAKKKGTKPLLTTFSVYNLERNNAFDYSKAKRELGYTTRSYAETLHDEVKWLKAEGKI
ncbi:NAD-dependent epimerase/dehydratase family protein [Anaerocolumna jejuensis]|uniref:NAD-dependent epimerase/dehydratase family protein n=1 Tax=Anaerocolumna jejuensis TaxID=259063 RepID=UPI003F7C504C